MGIVHDRARVLYRWAEGGGAGTWVHISGEGAALGPREGRAGVCSARAFRPGGVEWNTRHFLCDYLDGEWSFRRGVRGLSCITAFCFSLLERRGVLWAFQARGLGLGSRKEGGASLLGVRALG